MSTSSGGNVMPAGGGQASKKKPISEMSMGEMKRELQSYSVTVESIVGKKKLVKALQKARKENEHSNQQQQDVAIPSSPTGPSSNDQEAQNTPNTKTEPKPNATTAQNEKYGLLPEGRGTKKSISEMTVGEMKQELHFCYGVCAEAIVLSNEHKTEEDFLEAVEKTLKNARANLPSSSGPVRNLFRIDVALLKSKFPVAARTKDPLALGYDKARRFYEKGVQLLRQREHEGAAICVAKAFFLSPGPEVVVLCSGKDDFLDTGELRDLLSFALEKHLWAGPVLGACLTDQLIDADQRENFHLHSLNCLFHLRRLAGKTEQEPYKSFFIGLCGCLKWARAMLHYIAAGICKKMLDGDAGAIECRKALKADPKFTPARIECVWLDMHSPPSKLEDVYSELMSILGDVHEDYCDIEFVYAMMCEVLMRNPFVGTFEDLISYYEKALKAVDRHVELYGGPSRHFHQVFKILEDIRPVYENQHCERAQARKALVTLIPSNSGQKYLNFCCACKKDDMGKRLMRCAGCKTVWYCSKQCQAKHWSEHKEACKALAKAAKKMGA